MLRGRRSEGDVFDTAVVANAWAKEAPETRQEPGCAPRQRPAAIDLNASCLPSVVIYPAGAGRPRVPQMRGLRQEATRRVGQAPPGPGGAMSGGSRPGDREGRPRLGPGVRPEPRFQRPLRGGSKREKRKLYIKLIAIRYHAVRLSIRCSFCLRCTVCPSRFSRWELYSFSRRRNKLTGWLAFCVSLPFTFSGGAACWRSRFIFFEDVVSPFLAVHTCDMPCESPEAK